MIRYDQNRMWIGLLAVGVLALPLLATSAPPGAQTLTNEQVAMTPAGSQPIRFSHRVHAGDTQIDCQYCHIYARRSYVAGVPPMEVCAGCHKHVGTDLDEVKKVMDYWNKRQPIPWVKNFGVIALFAPRRAAVSRSNASLSVRRTSSRASRRIWRRSCVGARLLR